MRALVEIAVRRRVTVLMITLAVVAFGAVGYSRLTVDLLPDLSYPSLTVQTELADAAPAEVENLVTRPVEEAVGVLRGLQTVHSVSRSGVSEVTLEFDWDADMDALAMDVRDRIERLVLPEEAEDPIVLRFDPSLDPIARLAFYGGRDLIELRHIADKRLKQSIETVSGVAAAQVQGGLQEEIQVDIDQGRLATFGIPLQRVADLVRVSNVNQPGGALRDRDSQYLVRTLNEYGRVEDIASLIVGQDRDKPVYLRDVATVHRGHRERLEITRVDGEECVEIAIHKEGDANTVEVARALSTKLDELRSELPPGLKLAVLFDQSKFIVDAVNDVRSSALIGGLLAMVVLLVFLRSLRSALIIATTIPLSIIATFVFMYRLDVSLNIMSLGGLTLGVGMLVDNAIVVLEAIHSCRQRGLGLVQAAIAGTQEVGAAVVASTLTTVAVFVPILFVQGIAGQLFRDQALTVSVSLLVSLVAAITLCPVLVTLGRRLEPRSLAATRGPGAAVAAGTAPPLTLGRASRAYDAVVRGALDRPWLTLGIAAAAFAVSLAWIPRLGTELIPQVEQDEYFFEVALPEGTPLAGTDRVVQQMEELARSQPGVERVFASVGTRQVAGGMSLRTRDENLGQVNIAFDPGVDRDVKQRSLESMRARFAAIPDLQAKLGTPAYFSLRTPVEIVLFGDQLDELRDYADRLMPQLRDIPGLVDLRSSLEAGNPELQVVFDRERLAALGLDMRQVSNLVRDRVQGAVPTRYKEEDRQIDIRVRNRETDRHTLQDIRQLVLSEHAGVAVRLASVATVELARGPAEIHRLEQQRAAVISGNLAGRALGGVVTDIRAALDATPPPRGVTVELAGQNEEMQRSFASLRFALVLAVFLVYIVMAATFESLIHPFIILFTIPLALVGVVWGLACTGHPISIMVLMGFILLAGIVVDNAIVLIDGVNQLRAAGIEKRAALVLGGHRRLRPILMTSLTTVLGLVPMALAFGEGAELSAPLAVTVAFGLSVATALTLVVIPALYLLVPSKVEVRQAETPAVAAAGRTAIAFNPGTET